MNRLEGYGAPMVTAVIVVALLPMVLFLGGYAARGLRASEPAAEVQRPLSVVTPQAGAPAARPALARVPGVPPLADDGRRRARPEPQPTAVPVADALPSATPEAEAVPAATPVATPAPAAPPAQAAPPAPAPRPAPAPTEGPVFDLSG